MRPCGWRRHAWPSACTPRASFRSSMFITSPSSSGRSSPIFTRISVSPHHTSTTKTEHHSDTLLTQTSSCSLSPPQLPPIAPPSPPTSSFFHALPPRPPLTRMVARRSTSIRGARRLFESTSSRLTLRAAYTAVPLTFTSLALALLAALPPEFSLSLREAI